jgi:glycerophosphoryl diester phosphodiesterase
MNFVVNAVPASADKLQIIAHRGASYDAPENTIEAIRLAWQQGADGVEADFYLSADGQVVCIHDKDTQRVAGAKFVVKDTAYEDLKKLDVGIWKDPRWRGTRIPTLGQVLDEVPDGKFMVIELKVGPDIIEPVVRIIKKSSVLPEQIRIISFHADTIAECKRQLPAVPAHWLTSYKQQEDGTWQPGFEDVIAMLKRSGADGFGSQAQLEQFDVEFIQRLAEAGYPEFHVWTVDDPAVAHYYQGLGARWITTNRPGWLRDHMNVNRGE